MNPTLKSHLISAFITLVSSFATVLVAVLQAVPTESWTKASWQALLSGAVLTAVRAVFKPTMEALLGD